MRLSIKIMEIICFFCNIPGKKCFIYNYIKLYKIIYMLRDQGYADLARNNTSNII